jgi:hypothetical protein
LVSLALNANVGNTGITQVLAHVLANLVILLQQLRVTHTLGKPARAVILNNTKAKSGWMNLVSHEQILWKVLAN